MNLVGGEDLKQKLVAAHVRPAPAYYAWTQFTEGVTDLVASWLAPGGRGPAAEDPARFREALTAIVSSGTTTESLALQAQIAGHVSKGIPTETAESIVLAGNASMASEICALATAHAESIGEAARRYSAIGHASKLLPTLRLIAARRGVGRWDPVALGILKVRYRTLLRDVALRTAAGKELALGADKAAEALAGGPLKDVARIIDQIVGDSPDVASLLVGEQQIRAAIG
jgi:NAD-specific glutamate dehydrogenase